LNATRFNSDLTAICKLASSGLDREEINKLNRTRLHLLELYKKNLVKINHSVIELICARHLISQEYSVKVEHKLRDDLVCDVYGEKGEGNIIVEIETGFVPPSHAIDPARYCHARIISKTARYSPKSNKFVLGTTSSNILSIPAFFQSAPRFRATEDVRRAKAVCDLYYHEPPITEEQITYAELHSVFVIDVDRASIAETSPDMYISKTKNLSYS
jgi:hypothetical protein